MTVDGMASLRASLRLFEPLPTTDDNLWFQPTSYNAIQRTLNHSSFFFEELHNGTRLRIVSSAISQEQLTNKVATLVQTWKEQPVRVL